MGYLKSARLAESHSFISLQDLNGSDEEKWLNPLMLLCARFQYSRLLG